MKEYKQPNAQLLNKLNVISKELVSELDVCVWRGRFQDQDKDWAGVMFRAGQTRQDSHALRMVKDQKHQSVSLEQKWRGGLGSYMGR